MKNVTIEPDEVMVSFDIDSYFPSVPVPESINLLQSWLDTQTIHPMRRAGLVELTKVCMRQSFFKFRGNYYRQKSGTSMGNPLSPIICNFYVGELERKISQDPRFPRFWRRYVDDVFAIVKRDRIQETLNWLNACDQHIKFKHEVEKDCCLPFLEIKIIRNDRAIEFDIYRKQGLF